MSDTVRVNRSSIVGACNAIRDRTGTTNGIYPKNMESMIRAIPSGADYGDAPDYVIAEAQRVANDLVTKGGNNALYSIQWGDMHEPGESGENLSASDLENVRTGNKHAGLAAKIMADIIKPDYVADLGDVANGTNSTSFHDGLTSIRYAKGYTYAVRTAYKSFEVPGNHDPLTSSYATTGRYLDDEMCKALLGSYGYFDIEEKKVRIIHLNTSDMYGTDGTHGSLGSGRVSGEQLQWYCAAIDLSAKADAAQWRIFIHSHHPIDWAYCMPLANALAAYYKGTSYTATQNGVAVSYNFSGKNSARVVANIHAHVHGFRVDYIHYNNGGTITTLPIKRVAVPNACFLRTNEYGENGITEYNGIEFGQPEISYEKVAGTAQDTALCAFKYDLDTDIMYVNCYGAGPDRVVSCAVEEAVMYSITNTLTHVSTSNTAGQVVAGESYSATLTPESNYELDVVTITMGGVDITATAYSGGNINIASVTGDINITATAVYVDDFVYGDFTNLVPLSTVVNDSTTIYNAPYGYKDDYRLSGMSESAAVGYTLTGCMPYACDVNKHYPDIYIKGATLDTNDSKCRLSLIYVKADTGAMSAKYQIQGGATGASNMYSTYFTVEQLGDLYYRLTPVQDGIYAKEISHVMMSLKGSGEHLIVTVGEPIHKVDYTITSNLTHTTNSNAAVSIIEGASYSATLTAVSGYTIKTVIVTMGGADITSTAYSGGKISIPSVTGDIAITAVAEVQQAVSYTNLVPLATEYGSNAVYNGGKGYKDGAYLSSSAAPYEGTDAATVTTGYIPYAVPNAGVPGTIEIMGAEWAQLSHVRLYFFNSDKSIIAFYLNGSTTDTTSNNCLQKFFTLETLGDQHYRLTPIVDSGSSTGNWIALSAASKVANAEYIRFSLKGTGENLVITIDEPIQ